jgi:hypothetical protein
MANQAIPKRGITPPKGKPTRSRHDEYREKRVFGPVAQWIAFSVLLILAFLVLVILTNGGDFNPLNQNGGQVGTIATAIGASLSLF